MTDHDGRRACSQLICDRHRLFGIAYVIVNGKTQLLTQDTSGCVQVVDGLLRSITQLLAMAGVRSCHWGYHRDFYVGKCER